MIMNRRGFLGSILALGAAPAIVRADSLMRIVARDAGVLLPGGLWVPSGFASVDYSFYIAADVTLARVKTWDGANQYHVDLAFPSEHKITREDLAQGVQVLRDHVRHHHGSLAGFKATSAFDGAYRTEIFT